MSKVDNWTTLVQTQFHTFESLNFIPTEHYIVANEDAFTPIIPSLNFHIILL